MSRDFDKAFWSLITRGSYTKGELTQASVGSIMNHYLKRLQINLSQLNIIHVAGSKGKGSTCVQTEALLRARGLKTGLFTSPHLIDVRERFRMDGVPIHQTPFLQHFWYVWDTLHVEEDHETLPTELQNDPTYRPVPGFFRFMTCLAFRIFSAEKVDVAVIEVGIGGRLDATNVVKSPVVCGISLLDLDHVQILGNTLEQIATEKSGIMKVNVPCYTVRQETGAYNVLLEKSKLVGCELSTPINLRALDGTRTGVETSRNKKSRRTTGNGTEVRSAAHKSGRNARLPGSTTSSSAAAAATAAMVGRKRDRSHSNNLQGQFQLGLAGLHQETNASLALSLSRCYLRVKLPAQFGDGRLSSTVLLSSLEIRALEECRWPGRGQTVTANMVSGPVARNVFSADDVQVSSSSSSSSAASAATASSSSSFLTFRLDGAHTIKSIESCLQWYVDVTTARHHKILIFNCSHERNVGQLLQILQHGCPFDGVIFCPADVSRPSRLALPEAHEVAANMGVASSAAVVGGGSKDGSSESGGGEGLPQWQVIMRDAWNLLVEQDEYKKSREDGQERTTGQQPRGGASLVGGWAHTCDSIDSALAMLRKEHVVSGGSGKRAVEYQVLVTGSLYLVGGVLSRCGWNPDIGFEK